ASGTTAAGPHPGASEPARADGPQAPDEAGTAAVPAAESDHRAGVRPDQGGPGDRPGPAPWPGELPGRVEAGLRDPQPAEVVAGGGGPPGRKGVRPGRARFATE